MERATSKNNYSNAWSTSEKIYPSNIIKPNFPAKSTKNGLCENGMKPEENEESLYLKDGKKKMKTIRQLAMVINIAAGIISSGILINRASICIHK